MAGSLVAFFRSKVFRKKNKIFLGYTGSHTIGYLMVLITISLLECDYIGSFSKLITSIPVMTFRILIVPLFDTLRVFTFRTFRGESPMQAYRKHIHQRLLELGFTHLKALLLILGANLIILIALVIFREFRGLYLVAIVLLLATGLSYIPVYLVDK